MENTYEITKVNLELQIVREKLKLFPNNITLKQKEVELEKRLASLKQ